MTPGPAQPGSPGSRRLLRRLGMGAAACVILAGALVAVAALLLPQLARYPDAVARLLAERGQQAVAVERVEARWTRRGPLVALHGLRIGDPGDGVDIGRADLLVAVYSWLLPGRTLTELRLSGLALTLEQEADGRWRVHGLAGADTPDPLGRLQHLGEIQVSRAALRILPLASPHGFDVPRVDLRLRVTGDRLRAGVRAWPEEGTTPLSAVADLDRHRIEGRVWIGGQDLDLLPWSAPAEALAIQVVRAQGGFGAWLELADARIAELRLEARLDGVGLRSAAEVPGVAIGQARPDESTPAPHAADFQDIRASAHWRRDGSGWRLDVPALRLRHDGRERAMEDLTIVEGRRYGLRAERLDLGVLAALAPLAEDLPPLARAWLHAAAPHGQLHELSLAGMRGGGLVGRARLQDIGWDPVAELPGVEGLGGELRVDDGGGEFVFDPAPLRVDWRDAFAEPLEAAVDARVAFWRDAAGWHADSAGLRVEGAGADAGLYAATARGGMLFPAGGGRPHLRLAAELDAGRLSTARRFWVRHRMPATAVAWLDAALLDGTVSQGRAVIAGDLRHWPFADGEGRLEATARVDGARLHFHEDWPDLTGVDARLHFEGGGMRVEDASGALMDARIERGSARIPDFRDVALAVNASGGGDAAALLAVLRASPLGERHGQALSELEADGPAEVSLELELPLGRLRPRGAPEVRGVVSLAGGRLADPRWRVALDEVDGAATFGTRGFSADEVAVAVDGHPARLSMAAGESVADPANAFEARLEGELPIALLIAREPALAWLTPWARGDSGWRAQVAVAEAGAAREGALLVLESDLVGTELTLPAPLRKSAPVPMPLRVELPLPLENEEIRVRLGGLMRLRGALRGEDGFGASIVFGGAPAPAPPQRGVEVDGQVAVLDAAGWVALATGGPDGDAASVAAAPESDAADRVADEPESARDAAGEERRLELNRVDLVAGQLNVLDRAFDETRVHLTRDELSTVVRVEGPQVAGAVRVPAGASGTIHGEFERLYWPASTPTAATPAQQDMPPADDNDPARVPPLRFAIDDLRYGEARLGRTELATWPKPEGMRIQRFTTDSPSLRVEATGDWTRVGGRSRSRFNIDFSSESLGTMLDALGYSGVIEAGGTRATLVAGWPGSPGAFRLEELDGQLEIAIGEGSLLDVEPGGAGRVLGLLSLNALPRRLSLDFSDFFGRGFSFDRIDGHFDFGDGRARTRDLRIVGPAADVHVRGEANLRAQTYDQTVEVLPKASGVLTAVGALTGGPVGAAVGAVAQGVFRVPFQQATRVVYRITGPWADAEVVVAERGPAPAGPARSGSAETPVPDEIDASP